MTDARPWVPESPTLESLAKAADACHGCELWEPATQAVFGAGPPHATIILVGEQPGDREDKEGEPFVGPAGRILDDALGDLGLDRETVYVTNAVKHFRFDPRGKRRIHRKPDVSHMVACAPWLEEEIALVDPEVVVCLGATAGRAVLGRPVKIGEERGRLQPYGDRQALVTTHPSAVVRLRGRDGFAPAYEAFVADLRVAAAT